MIEVFTTELGTENRHAKKILVDELSSVSDFVVFKTMMLERNKSLDAATVATS